MPTPSSAAILPPRYALAASAPTRPSRTFRSFGTSSYRHRPPHTVRSHRTLSLVNTPRRVGSGARRRKPVRYGFIAQNAAEKEAYASGELYLPAIDLIMPLV